jgi:prolyl oligopeptidase
MKRVSFLITLLILLGACSKKGLHYPITKKVDTVDVYFGTKVPDPYRWLENDNSEETKTWVKNENEVTFSYLNAIPFREKIKNRLTTIWNFARINNLQKKSGIYFYEKNTGLQNQNVFYYQVSLKDSSRILLDPNTLSKDGTSALNGFAISEDGKYLAYGISKSGSDWVNIYFKEIISGKQLVDSLNWVKFSNITWSKNGIFYSRYDEPQSGKGLTDKNQYQKLYYHQLNTSQSKDQLIIKDDKDPIKMFGADVTDDGRYLIIYETRWGFDGNKLIIKDLSHNNSKFINLGNNYDYEFNAIGSFDQQLFILTNYKALKKKVISVNLNAPEEKNWKDIISEKDYVLESASLFDTNRIIGNYLKDAHSKIEVFENNGKYLKDIDLPSIGSVSSLSSKAGDKEMFLTFTSFTQPPTSYLVDEIHNSLTPFAHSELLIDTDDFITEQIFFPSKDGTKIPMFIVHKKSIKLDGQNPCLLYGYGGFNISETPGFSISRLMWLENGGVYGMVNLRGGGEYGKEWHDAGTKLKKQNVFDDFIAAAEYLNNKKFTTPEKLAIIGGSNGGLLIGAVANQRPDLFGVAIPMVGVMDMLRFHKFTIGGSWVTDYGSSDDSVQFRNLIKFSPLHNISDKMEYPAILVTTADHDDRVVPAHSFKYIATLQDKYKGNHPVLIRIQTKAGHGAGKPTAIVIDEQTDIYSFIFKNMGIQPKY